MTPIYGDLTLVDGRVINLKTEIGSAVPAFHSDEVGRLFFVNVDGTLRINDGSEWVTIQYSNTDSSSPLLVTLGTNWINSDLSFNPTPFNDLDNISGLTANSTLFSVVAALDAAITIVGSKSLESLNDVTFSSLETGDIVIWGGASFTNISLTNLAAARLTISTTSLVDIQQTPPYTPGDVLVFSNIAQKFVNRQTSFTYTNTASDSAFSVDHNLGVRYPLVQIINAATNASISTGYTINYNSDTNLTVTLSAPAAVIIIVAAVNNS